MKPFSLDEYLKNPSKGVVTKDGRNARIICTDVKSRYPIAAAVEKSECGCSEGVYTYTKDGRLFDSRPSVGDLFFAPEKHEGWINIYSGSSTGGNIYDSEEEARKMADVGCIATIKIEWEEC